MQHIHIREAFKTGWKKLMERPWYFTGVTALLIVLVFATSSQAMFSALAYIVLGGYMALLLAYYNGKNIALDDLFDLVDKRWIYFVFAAALKTLLIMVGFLCLILPGIYIAVRLMFTELLVLDKGMRPVKALRTSLKMTKGHFWKLLLFSLCMTLVVILGFVVLIVGVLPATVIGTFAVIHVYKSLSDIPQTENE